jgi:hypothetical protein
LIATINGDLKEALYNELIDILSKDIKDVLRKEIKVELHSGMKKITLDNFNKTLYKDL